LAWRTACTWRSVPRSAALETTPLAKSTANAVLAALGLSDPFQYQSALIVGK
jgi:hypothetical protein